MVTVLFSRPRHDDTTAYLYVYSKDLVNFASERFKCLNEEGGNANKNRITSIITKQKPEFIMFNGHGDSRTIYGHKNESLIEVGKNHNLLNSKIVYSVSCGSALELGPKSIEAGAKAFIGYCDDFALGMDSNYQARPLKDKRAKLFLEPSNLLVTSLLKRNAAHEALRRSKMAIIDNMSFLMTDPSTDSIDYVPWLYHNYANLVLHGDPDAHL